MIDDIEKPEDDEDEGGSGTGRRGSINTSDLFREARAMAGIRTGETEFGPVWTETKVDEIYVKLLAERTDPTRSAGQDLGASLSVHPLLDSPQLDGIADRLIELQITDPEMARKLVNELQLKHQKQLQAQATPTFTPRPTPY
jgi:hypothetical protein